MLTLLHPTYFPNIKTFIAIAKAESLVFEVHDNYQKQTYRNRTYIYGANGKLALNIPITHSHKNRELYKDVKIVNDNYWQSQHWKSLQSAYRTSPYFEFYEDELAILFHKKYNYIMDFNFECINKIFECLQLETTYQKTTTYSKEIENTKDLRYLANVRKEKQIMFSPYTQVFGSKYGFINNLSILDLLFNEGTNALEYLESQQISL